MSRALLLLLVAAVVAAVSITVERHRPLDPDEPIAVDGSLIAGGARTFDSLQTPVRIAIDHDSPAEIEARLKLEQVWTDRVRSQMAALVGSDIDLCNTYDRERLIAALHAYYDARGRQKTSFAMRGPNGRSAIEEAWATGSDRMIDQFVRYIFVLGFLRVAEIEAPPRSDGDADKERRPDFVHPVVWRLTLFFNPPGPRYPEFINVVGAIKSANNPCATANAHDR
jgi:hypothetical protein